MSDIIEKKKTKTTKTKVDKYNGFNVPNPRGWQSCFKGAVYLYKMIQEAKPELLQNDGVRKAYNDFVEFLKNNYDLIYSTTPAKSYKYYPNNIKVDPNNKLDVNSALYKYYIYNTCFTVNISVKNVDEVKENFDKYYIPLYDLIKRDVIPYMELKEWEQRREIDTEYYGAAIQKSQNIIKYYQTEIEKLEKKIYDMAQKSLELQSPPTLSSFD